MTFAWPPFPNFPSPLCDLPNLPRLVSSLPGVKLSLLINSPYAHQRVQTLYSWGASRLLVRHTSTLAWVFSLFFNSSRTYIETFFKVPTNTKSLTPFPRVVSSSKLVVAESQEASKCNLEKPSMLFTCNAILSLSCRMHALPFIPSSQYELLET